MLVFDCLTKLASAAFPCIAAGNEIVQMGAYLLTVMAQIAPTSQILLIPQLTSSTLYRMNDMQVICPVTSAFPKLSLTVRFGMYRHRGEVTRRRTRRLRIVGSLGCTVNMLVVDAITGCLSIG